MQWCDNEQNDFPDSEFSTDGGVLYPRRPGGSRHRAGPGSVSTPYPADEPSTSLYGLADGGADDGGADGAADDGAARG